MDLTAFFDKIFGRGCNPPPSYGRQYADRPASINPSSDGIRTWPCEVNVSTTLPHTGNRLAEMALSEPHTLIAGTTGSGKSVLVHSILYESLTRHPYDAGLILVDLKRVELFRYSKLPFRIIRYACDPSDVTDALALAVSCVRKRLDTMQANGLTQSRQGHVYVVVDELADMIQTCGKEALEHLSTIGRLGRCANVHFICATQAPDRRTCPACLAQNATLRVGLRCQTGIESRQIINQAGAELLPRYGNALVLKDGYVTRMKVDMVSDSDIASRIDLWANKTTYTNGQTGRVILNAKTN